MLLVRDEAPSPAPGRGRFHEWRTACLLTADGRRDVSGTGVTFLHHVRAALGACLDRSLLVIADEAAWIRSFFRDHLAALPQAEMLRDGSHLARTCEDRAARIYPHRARRRALLRRLLRALWTGDVERALTVLKDQRRHAADLQAVDDLSRYLQARAAWIPHDRARRRTCRYIGSGLAEKANDRILVRRQKRRGMQWGAQTSDALAALRTLHLNEGWDHYWQERHLPRLTAASPHPSASARLRSRLHPSASARLPRPPVRDGPLNLDAAAPSADRERTVGSTRACCLRVTDAHGMTRTFPERFA